MQRKHAISPIKRTVVTAVIYAMRAVFAVLAWLPLAVLHGMGAILGRLIRHLPIRSAKLTRRNIALCFPQLSAAQQRDLVRTSLIEDGKSMLEQAYLWRHGKSRFNRLQHAVTGQEYFDQGLANPNGLLILAPHLGAWEMVSFAINQQQPFTVLYRAPDYAALEQWLLTARARTGASLLRADASGMRALFRVAADGGNIGILPDQQPKRGAGVFAPFFGHQAFTMVLVPRLAARYRPTVVWAVCERLPHGRGFHSHYVPADEQIYDADAAISAASMNRDLEALVQRFPAQYQWAYKRFSLQPEGAPSLYKQ